jgi:hypothetical protein
VVFHEYRDLLMDEPKHRVLMVRRRVFLLIIILVEQGLSYAIRTPLYNLLQIFELVIRSVSSKQSKCVSASSCSYAAQ